jgi:phosphatidylglycerol:prolipoprotein diacylglycerol transferase
MIEFTRESILIYGFPVYYYGIILMFGVAASTFLASREAKRKEMDTDFLWDSLIWVVIGGILGARLWHIITPPPSMVEQGITFQYYLTHPLEALNIRLGGLGIAGAVIGGLITFFIYAKRKGQNFAQWIDIAAPVIPLGQAIGRWGNFINQELYGAPSELPWAIFVDAQHRLPEFLDVAYYHPIFLYESLWNLASVFFLLWVSRRYIEKLLPGDVFLLYLITYPTIRILLDFIRLDASEIAGLNANQVFMAAVLLASIFGLFLRHRYKGKAQN